MLIKVKRACSVILPQSEYLGGFETVLYEGGRLRDLRLLCSQSIHSRPCWTMTSPRTTANTPPRMPRRKKNMPCNLIISTFSPANKLRPPSKSKKSWKFFS